MTSIKIIKEVGGHDKGDIVDLSPGSAAYLVNAGYAEEAEPQTDSPKRTRRTQKSDEASSEEV